MISLYYLEDTQEAATFMVMRDTLWTEDILADLQTACPIFLELEIMLIPIMVTIFLINSLEVRKRSVCLSYLKIERNFLQQSKEKKNIVR